MKIEEIILYDEENYREGLMLKVDGEIRVRFLDEEPEDNCIARNFSGIYSIKKLMRNAYEAGKRGENFEVVEVTASDFEEWYSHE